MKKQIRTLILGFIIAVTIVSTAFGQQATSTLQRVGNNTLTVISNSVNALYNKYDTTIKVFAKTYTLPVLNTNTVANSFIIGSESSLSFTLNLGNYYYELVDLEVRNLLGNYGTNINVMIFRDTVLCSNNTAWSYIPSRALRLLNAFVPTVSPVSSLNGIVYGYLQAYYNKVCHTGLITILPYWSTASGGALGSQVINITAVYRRVKS